jgi:hypothetical protein
MENTDLSDMVQLAAHGVPRHEIEIVARAYGDIHSFSGHTQGGGSSIGGVTVPAVSSPLLFQPFSFLPVAEIKLNIRMAHTDKPMFLVSDGNNNTIVTTVVGPTDLAFCPRA